MTFLLKTNKILLSSALMLTLVFANAGTAFAYGGWSDDTDSTDYASNDMVDSTDYVNGGEEAVYTDYVNNYDSAGSTDYSANDSVGSTDYINDGGEEAVYTDYVNNYDSAGSTDYPANDSFGYTDYASNNDESAYSDYVNNYDSAGSTDYPTNDSVGSTEYANNDSEFAGFSDYSSNDYSDYTDYTNVATNASYSDIGSHNRYNYSDSSRVNYSPSFVFSPRFVDRGSNGRTVVIRQPSTTSHTTYVPYVVHTPTQTQSQTQVVNNPAPAQPIIINNPAPQPVASQPINIVNNNVNTNVNNPTPAPATTPAPQPVAHPLQCAVYATPSAYKGAKVTISWATDGGNKTSVYCTGNVLANRVVNPVDTQNIYPWQNTTCYVRVERTTTGESKTCSVNVPVNTPVAVQQPTYPVYTAPVAVASASAAVNINTAPVKTVKKPAQFVSLTRVPYTGWADNLAVMFYITIVLSAIYATYRYRGVVLNLKRV